MSKRPLVIILSVLAALVLLVVLFAGAIIGIVFYSVSQSDAAKTAKTFLRNSERLKQDIGEVKDFGSLVTGSVKSRNNNGDATLYIKVIGQKRTTNATVVLMYRSGRNWRVTEATYENEAGQTVDLIGQEETDPSPPEP
ncbi:MAG TPA: cytochrome c oxidase assembly factor Coa1 family protein [Pyrinomonadaceae bacterium]|nr:cytochrome c oxidase assembly factor Coa1 family protein [Pyrinomonadaceae bacterium]